MFFQKWSASEQVSVFVTIISALITGTLAIVPTLLFVQAASADALGGLIHEIAQSGGKIFFMQKRDDGLYLGSLTGMILGSVSGLLILQGFLPSSKLCPTKNIPSEFEEGCNEFIHQTQRSANTALVLEMFLAGIALKGISEAATGSEVSNSNDTNSNSVP